MEIVLAYKRLMLTANFSNFTQYYSTAFGYYCVKMPEDMNNSNWLTGTCTCPSYFKQYICKHILLFYFMSSYAINSLVF